MSTKPATLLDVQPEDRPGVGAVEALARATQPVEPTDPFVAMLERLATNPATNMDVFERLLAARDREKANAARELFEHDFAQMQGELPAIDENGRIVVSGEVRSKYAKLEDIITAVRPVLMKHGFSLRFRNVTEEGKHKTIGILAHRGGHSETDEFITAPDTSGAKNAIQAIGSARSYGQRYCAIALLNIVSREPGYADDDGEGSERPETPEHVAQFLAKLRVAAHDGMKPLFDVWNAGSADTRRFITAHYKQDWQALRAEAGKVKA